MLRHKQPPSLEQFARSRARPAEGGLAEDSRSFARRKEPLARFTRIGTAAEMRGFGRPAARQTTLLEQRRAAALMSYVAVVIVGTLAGAERLVAASVAVTTKLCAVFGDKFTLIEKLVAPPVNC